MKKKIRKIKLNKICKWKKNMNYKIKIINKEKCEVSIWM